MPGPPGPGPAVALALRDARAIVTRAPSARNGAKGIVRLRALQPFLAISTSPATDPAANEMTIASITSGAQVEAEYQRQASRHPTPCRRA